MSAFTVADPTSAGIIDRRQSEISAFQEAPATAPAADLPWYARPVESVTKWFGNTTVDTGKVMIQTQDGKLTVAASNAARGQTNIPGGDFASFIKQVPMPVWIGAGAIGLLLLLRR